jgi:hypothetical protein
MSNVFLTSQTKSFKIPTKVSRRGEKGSITIKRSKMKHKKKSKMARASLSVCVCMCLSLALNGSILHPCC